MDRLVALIVAEEKWLTLSMSLAGVAVAGLLLRQRRTAVPARQRITAAMNLSAGVIIGTMAFGHLLAVTTKLALGTLREASLPILFGIGISLLIPALMVTRHTRTLLAGTVEGGSTTVLLQAWLATTLLVLGPHNWPLSAMSVFTIAYRLHQGRLWGWAIVTVAVAFSVALYAASLVFLASGQSFEQFRGMQ
jgi:hypothetical protein